MIQRLTSLATVTVIAAALALPTVEQAEAGKRGRVAAGVAGAIIGLGILGAYAHSRGDRYYDEYDYYEPACYRGPRRCHWVRGRCWYNRWGERVCSRGRRRCHRPVICD